jgi:hypothetical protein
MSSLSPSNGIAVPVPAPNDVVVALVADELDRIRGLLEDLGIMLCGDDEIVRRYTEVLQGLDELSQRNENLARVLRASDMIGAAGEITLGSLRDRMVEAIEFRQAGTNPWREI